jgi:hypothetical protein
VDALSLCHSMIVGCMTADFERTGLYYGTVGMVAVIIEMGSPFVNPVKMRTSWAVGYYNASIIGLKTIS